MLDIGLDRLIACSINESLPKSSIIRELDDNIQKYAKEKISDKDILFVATRIANKNLLNIEKLNKLAEKDEKAFIKKLQEEADKEREIEEKRTVEFSSFIQKLEDSGKKLEKLKGTYEENIEVLKIKQSALDNKEQEHQRVINELKESLEKEKQKNSKAENEQRKTAREKFVYWSVFWWRGRTVLWLLLFPLLVAIYILLHCSRYDWNWNYTKQYFEELDKNILFVLFKWTCGIVYAGIFIKIFSDKFGESNKSKFIEKIEIPEEYKELK